MHCDLVSINRFMKFNIQNYTEFYTNFLNFQNIDLSSVITSQSAANMSQPSLKQWYEDRKRLRVVYDHSRAKPVERKNKIKKSRQAAFRSVLAERTKPSIQHQDTKSNTSDSSLGKEQSGAHAKRYNRSFGAFTQTEYREKRVYNSWEFDPFAKRAHLG